LYNKYNGKEIEILARPPAPNEGSPMLEGAD